MPFKTREKEFIKKPKKAEFREVDRKYLAYRVAYVEKLGYPKQKWVCFCEAMLDRGFRVTLYEAKGTVSKYVRVFHGHKVFKVRFSDHAPNARKEREGDCDFFVGKTHYGITNTDQAIAATLKFFKEAPCQPQPKQS